MKFKKFTIPHERSKHSNDAVSYAILMLPGILLYLFFVIVPALFSIVLGFTEWSGSGAPAFVGLKNYVKMFSDPVFWLGIRNNMLLIFISVFIQMPLGFLFAYIIYRKLIKGTQFFQAMIFLPVAISVVIVAILWNQIFAPGGVFTSLVRLITKDPRYVVTIFENKTFAIVPVLFVNIWYYTGIGMIIFVANMRKIPADHIEAAIIDGATERDIMLKIISPQMRTVIFSLMIFSISGSLMSFNLIFAMTGGGPAHYTEVVSIYMYFNAFKYYNYGFGNAVATVMLLFCVLCIGFLQIIFKRLEKKYG